MRRAVGTIWLYIVDLGALTTAVIFVIMVLMKPEEYLKLT